MAVTIETEVVAAAAAQTYGCASLAYYGCSARCRPTPRHACAMHPRVRTHLHHDDARGVGRRKHVCVQTDKQTDRQAGRQVDAPGGGVTGLQQLLQNRRLNHLRTRHLGERGQMMSQQHFQRVCCVSVRAPGGTISATLEPPLLTHEVGCVCLIIRHGEKCNKYLHGLVRKWHHLSAPAERTQLDQRIAQTRHSNMVPRPTSRVIAAGLTRRHLLLKWPHCICMRVTCVKRASIHNAAQ